MKILFGILLASNVTILLYGVHSAFNAFTLAGNALMMILLLEESLQEK